MGQNSVGLAEKNAGNCGAPRLPRESPGVREVPLVTESLPSSGLSFTSDLLPPWGQGLGVGVSVGSPLGCSPTARVQLCTTSFLGN